MLLHLFWEETEMLRLTRQHTLLPTGYMPVAPQPAVLSAAKPTRLTATAHKKIALQAIPGCSVQVISLQDGLRYRFSLVTHAHPDISQGELCQHSPLGQAMLGKRVGQQVKLNLPGVRVHFIITDILNELGSTN